jgi:hypothetical protein
MALITRFSVYLAMGYRLLSVRYRLESQISDPRSLLSVCKFDSENSPIEDHEYPEEDNSDGAWDSDDQWSEAELAECPNCGTEVYEDSVRCPVCDSYITFGANVWDGKSLWWIVLGLIGIAATCVALALL